ncbi:MAG: hypothetical protein M0Q91_05090 [Methanoregula sp.]|jgi:hypothetical protein|nr:hypothetical protein [Methanoregula sp.]
MIALALVTALSFLVYCPIICYLDWKYRDIFSHKLWLPLIAFNIPLLLAGYATGTYPPTLALISGIGIILWIVLIGISLGWLGKRPNEDFVWLCLISIFMVVNPFNGQPFMSMFSFFLVGMTAAAYWAVFVDNVVRKHVLSLRMENGIPYLIPISCALILALVVS